MSEENQKAVFNKIKQTIISQFEDYASFEDYLDERIIPSDTKEMLNTMYDYIIKIMAEEQVKEPTVDNLLLEIEDSIQLPPKPKTQRIF